ncbi:hypothetical protein COB57_04810 [Candidatus Peregrinibacteria bacterium]|nr:MAG: hypothetical protein COB57_04810 [Candidatus Peregrinibacteria bacterium]
MALQLSSIAQSIISGFSHEKAVISQATLNKLRIGNNKKFHNLFSGLFQTTLHTKVNEIITAINNPILNKIVDIQETISAQNSLRTIVEFCQNTAKENMSNEQRSNILSYLEDNKLYFPWKQKNYTADLHNFASSYYNTIDEVKDIYSQVFYLYHQSSFGLDKIDMMNRILQTVYTYDYGEFGESMKGFIYKEASQNNLSLEEIELIQNNTDTTEDMSLLQNELISFINNTYTNLIAKNNIVIEKNPEYLSMLSQLFFKNTIEESLYCLFIVEQQEEGGELLQNLLRSIEIYLSYQKINDGFDQYNKKKMIRRLHMMTTFLNMFRDKENFMPNYHNPHKVDNYTSFISETIHTFYPMPPASHPSGDQEKTTEIIKGARKKYTQQPETLGRHQKFLNE